jgi:hypothetical protein
MITVKTLLNLHLAHLGYYAEVFFWAFCFKILRVSSLLFCVGYLRHRLYLQYTIWRRGVG